MVTPKHKPNPAFVVRLVGHGISPWAVPMRSLATVLQAVQRLIERRDELDDDDDIAESESVQGEPVAVLHLLGVKSSSAVYLIDAPDQFDPLSVLRQVQEAIEEPEAVDWLDSTLSSVKDISEVANSLGCEIEFSEPSSDGKIGGVVAKITPKTYSNIEGSAYIKASTSIYAKIERVGGAVEMRCGIRLPNAPRKMVICRVKTGELVRELGQYMYQYVILSGQATWLRHNWRLKRMIIDSCEPPKTGSIREALRMSHEAGGCAWDSISDPQALIAEMRGA